MRRSKISSATTQCEKKKGGKDDFREYVTKIYKEIICGYHTSCLLEPGRRKTRSIMSPRKLVSVPLKTERRSKPAIARNDLLMVSDAW